MLFFEIIMVAVHSVGTNLFRSMLTMLGIIIGVAAVITMVALGSGAQQAVSDQLDKLGSNLLTIRSGQSFMKGVARAGFTLTAEDAISLATDMPTVMAVVPEISQSQQIKFGNKNRSITVVGTTPNYMEVHNFTLQYGRMISLADNASKRRVAVLGGSMPGEFNTDAELIIGRTISIQGISFEVIGVFKEKGSTGFRNPDKQIWIPLLTSQYRVAGTDKLKSISVQVSNEVSPEVAMIDVERVLRATHKILPGARNDFTISDRLAFLEAQQAATEVFAYLMASIAGISLVVGGIGIMNIMLVTVTERTREIGLRKALGATKLNILIQFLVEAMGLCIVGGLLGIILGATVASLLAEFAGWKISISMAAVAIAFFFSAGVGLFFGLWPARKAASLDPIEALRYE